MENLVPAIDDGKADEVLPEGWTVQVNIRKDGRKDRRYTEPIHGYTFRSMKEVNRYVESGLLGSRSTRSPRDKDAAANDLLASAKRLDFGTMNDEDESLKVSNNASPITTILPEIHAANGQGIGPSSTKAAAPEVDIQTNGFNKGRLPRRASRRNAGPPRKLNSTPTARQPYPKRKQLSSPAVVRGGESGGNRRKKGNDVDADEDCDELAPSVKQCLDMVESIPGVDDDLEFDLTIVASRLFVKKIYRVMFISLREDKRLKWLREYAREGVTAD
ncbi:hypothetical protein LINGRAHAP2_LOCUS22154 [Linum grandiflorum]